MRHRSKTNSHKFRDLKLQQMYRDQFDYCELTPWLLRNIPRLADRNDYSLHLHHICGGNGGRYDYWTNFIRLSGTVHDWITNVDSTSGNVLCLWKKMTKNEIDLKHLRICYGRPLHNWLSNHKPTEVAIIPCWSELVHYAERNDHG